MGGLWPSLERPGWEGTRDHLRLWSQIIGKTMLAFAPPVNHWWHVALHLSPHGLTTGAIPAPDRRHFEVELDLLEHKLVASTSDGRSGELSLARGNVASFFAHYRNLLASLGLHPRIFPRPVESIEVVRFDEDRIDRPYDPEWAGTFFQALRQVDRLMALFRGGFIGKASPVNFFWGSFDLAATRFSGRTAPLHPGGVPNCPDYVAWEAYSHECSSAGFWPGDGASPAAFYSYAYPEPAGYRQARIAPAEAFYHPQLREFVLPYGAVRTSGDPERSVLLFLQSTYSAAADRGHWDRDMLERASGGEPWRVSVSTFGKSNELSAT